MTFRGQETAIHAGDVFLIGPNAVIDVVGDPEGCSGRGAAACCSPPAALDAFGLIGSELALPQAPTAADLAGVNADVVHRIQVPSGERRAWRQGIGLIERELVSAGSDTESRPSSFCWLSAPRLAGQGEELHGRPTGLLDAVFAVIEQRFASPRL